MNEEDKTTSYLNFKGKKLLYHTTYIRFKHSYKTISSTHQLKTDSQDEAAIIITATTFLVHSSLKAGKRALEVHAMGGLERTKT